MKARWTATWPWLLLACTAYALVSILAYSLRNPTRTDTQRFLEIPRALTWQDAPQVKP